MLTAVRIELTGSQQSSGQTPPGCSDLQSDGFRVFQHGFMNPSASGKRSLLNFKRCALDQSTTGAGNTSRQGFATAKSIAF
jgi:hypothetical protein